VNGPLLALCIVLLLLQLALPFKWAFMPLLLAACHTPYTADFGGFTVARLVIVVGLMRAAGGGAIRFDWHSALDRRLMVFAAVAILSAVGHDALFSNPYIYRIGLVLNVLGTYFYARTYLATDEVLERLAKGLVITLVPFAFLMVIEKQTGINPYSKLGTEKLTSLVRDGKIRAQGPFGTPILAGTVGASSIPLFIPLWKSRRRLASTGLAACLVISYCSASSGPISTVLLGMGAIALWRVRAHMRGIQIATICMLVVLHFIKERPIWYLMALMDFVGGSTGWHRAYLIDTAVRHMGEWWLWGTDLTGHWMPYSLPTNVPGVSKADLTNYYLHLGVIGGLPLLFCLIAVQWSAFSQLGRKIREFGMAGTRDEFALWCVGAALFAHSVTFLSISYFDQMFVFFWMIVGCLPAMMNAREDAGADFEPEWDTEQNREGNGSRQATW
jgi:hypothetical protein